MTLNHMWDILDDKWPEEQVGFRPKGSHAEQIFTLHHIIDKCQEFQVQLAVSFINFRKALDSIHRPSLWNILVSYGVPNKSVYAFERIYYNSSCCAWADDGCSSWFLFITAVWQGCLLSPLLFSIAIDWVLQLATKEQGLAWLKSSHLLDLNFAKYIVVMA